MVNKFHVEPRPVNSVFSADVFAGMLDKTDDEKIFFLTSDISRLAPYKNTLDAEIKHRKTGYLTLFINSYRIRLKQADSLATEIGKKPFELYGADKFTAAEQNSFPTSVSGMQQKLYKKIKAAVLDEVAANVPGKFKTYPPLKQKKYRDSAEAASRKKIISSLKRKINYILQNPHGITQYVGNLYCETIASCFDPHTEFFSPDEKENFESELGKQPLQFGFRIKGDKSGGVLIENLQAGSPAYKCGKLTKGDKFMTVLLEGGSAVDVSDISIHEFNEIIEQSGHSVVLFTMKKLDGSLVQVSLKRELAANDDDEKVKSFILKGPNSTVGYIYLPAFYQDWEATDNGLNGCANDVGREILKLKKENITGLILDVRYNGGGSVSEATDLAGIFIDAGPVAQAKDKDAKVYAIKNINRGTLYDGPLVILVNGYSASASELLAGTLQDYNRAVVIGSPTYGKATMQIVLPMDTTVNFRNFNQVQTANNLKLTTSKLYRITGNTAQKEGVHPDIVLPDLSDAFIKKEADEPFALQPTDIAPNKYYTPFAPLPIKQLISSVQKEIDTSKYFNTVKKLTAEAKKQKEEKDFSLNLKDAIATAQNDDEDIADIAAGNSNKFKVSNNQYELSRLQTDSSLKELNDEFSKQISSDAYINIAFSVLSKLKTP